MFRKKNEDEGYSVYEADDYSSYQYENNNYQGGGNGGDYRQDEEPEGKVRFSLASKIIIVFALYFVFLMFGVFSTSFVPNEFGMKEAQVITVENREARKDYNSLKQAYMTVTSFVRGVEAAEADRERVLVNSFELATEYQTSLSLIDQNVLKLNKIEIDNRYGSVKNQITDVYGYGAEYLSAISETLMAGGIIDSNEILSRRYNFYQQYNLLTENMKQFAATLKIDDYDFYTKSETVFNYEVPDQNFIQEGSGEGMDPAAYATPAAITPGAVTETGDTAEEILSSEGGIANEPNR